LPVHPTPVFWLENLAYFGCRLFKQTQKKTPRCVEFFFQQNFQPDSLLGPKQIPKPGPGLEKTSPPCLGETLRGSGVSRGGGLWTKATHVTLWVWEVCGFFGFELSNRSLKGFFRLLLATNLPVAAMTKKTPHHFFLGWVPFFQQNNPFFSIPHFPFFCFVGEQVLAHRLGPVFLGALKISFFVESHQTGSPPCPPPPPKISHPVQGVDGRRVSFVVG